MLAASKVKMSGCGKKKAKRNTSNFVFVGTYILACVAGV